jgi:RHS repeat-associated protein
VFAYNLRYPGQYFDGETGLSYNYFRDYDPQVGRYVESDPIGLKGGINTYDYVKDRPTNSADPTGQSIGAVGAGIIVGYACWTTYCVKSWVDKCARRFPNHTDPLSSDYEPFARCQRMGVTSCLTLGMFGIDPLGEAAKEVGGKIGERLQDP